MKKAVLIAIGDELLSGLRNERNCTWLAGAFHDAGWEVQAIEIIPDDLDRIVQELSKWKGKVDSVVTSGGLGPTHDDRTREAVAAFMDCGLRIDEEAYDRIVERYNGDLRDIVRRSKNRQGLIPEKAEPVHNPEGSALGMTFSRSGTLFWSFPGVPSEFQAMARMEILKGLISPGRWRALWITGWAESILKDRLREIFEDPGLHVSVLPSVNLIQVVLRGEKDLINEAESRIREILPDDCLPPGVSSLETAVLQELKRKEIFAGCAESCTGGMICSALTDIPGASDSFLGGVVSYSNDCKISLLGVNRHVIEKYGAVSSQCAAQMAIGAAKVLCSDISLSVTGIAGPEGGSDIKPVGTVWYGILYRGECDVVSYLFSGSREQVRKRACAKGLELLWRKIKVIRI